jgi:hypothetical protein
MLEEHDAWHKRHDAKTSLLRLEQIKLIFAIDRLTELVKRATQTSPTFGQTASSPPPTSNISMGTTAVSPTTESARKVWTSRARWLLPALKKAAPKIAVWIIEQLWQRIWSLLWVAAVTAYGLMQAYYHQIAAWLTKLWPWSTG